MPNPAKLLILSDIHLGTLSDIPDFNVSEHIDPGSLVREASAIKAALDDEGLVATTILIPGDLTSRGTPQEFADCNLFVQEVAKSLAIPDSKTIVTYGNHDVDWRVGNLESGGSRRDLYCSLGSLSASLFAPSAEPTHPGVEVGSGIYHFEELTLIVLNSGRFCYPISEIENHKYHHGKIGIDQLNWLKAIAPDKIQSGRPCVLMIHHHLVNLRYPVPASDISTLEEGAEVMTEIGRLGVDLVIHGHRHHPIVFSELQTGWIRPVSFFCAGSYGVASHHRSFGMIPNTFHFVEFDVPTTHGNYGGNIFTFERCMDRMWRPIRNGLPNVALDRRQGFGFATTVEEAKAQIDSIIGNVAQSLNGHLTAVSLPNYDSLNQALRCFRVDELNRLFSDRASLSGFEVTGEYPKSCILTRN